MLMLRRDDLHWATSSNSFSRVSIDILADDTGDIDLAVIYI